MSGRYAPQFRSFVCWFWDPESCRPNAPPMNGSLSVIGHSPCRREREDGTAIKFDFGPQR